jgi:hypothetical protein
VSLNSEIGCFSSSSFAPIAMAIIQRDGAIESETWRWAHEGCAAWAVIFG